MADLSIPKHNTPGEAAVLPILIDGKWVEKRERDAVRSPFDGGIVSYKPKSTRSDFNAALDAAVRAWLEHHDGLPILRLVAEANTASPSAIWIAMSTASVAASGTPGVIRVRSSFPSSSSIARKATLPLLPMS